MENIELLFKMNYNKSYRFKSKLIDKNHFLYKNHNRKITGFEIRKLLYEINYYTKNYMRTKIPFNIDLGEIELEDKLVFMVLECIIYYLDIIVDTNVRFNFKLIPSIRTDGDIHSALFNYCHSNNKQTFVKEFEYLNISNKYRYIFPKNQNSDEAQIKTSEIYTFIYNNLIEKKIDSKESDVVANKLWEIINELIDNAIRYGNSETLVDIDITDKTYKKKDDNVNNYYGINIGVISFSERLFYEPLKENFAEIQTLPNQYRKIKEAYDKHIDFFDKKYNENEFYSLASFQNGITGELEDARHNVGGTGLTKLIKGLQERADFDNIYLISGNQAIWFKNECLMVDNNNLISFNEDKDFINCPPSRYIVGASPTFFPGVAYLLSFVVKE